MIGGIMVIVIFLKLFVLDIFKIKIVCIIIVLKNGWVNGIIFIYWVGFGNEWVFWLIIYCNINLENIIWLFCRKV